MTAFIMDGSPYILLLVSYIAIVLYGLKNIYELLFRFKFSLLFLYIMYSSMPCLRYVYRQ